MTLQLLAAPEKDRRQHRAGKEQTRPRNLLFYFISSRVCWRRWVRSALSLLSDHTSRLISKLAVSSAQTSLRYFCFAGKLSLASLILLAIAGPIETRIMDKGISHCSFVRRCSFNAFIILNVLRIDLYQDDRKINWHRR